MLGIHLAILRWTKPANGLSSHFVTKAVNASPMSSACRHRSKKYHVSPHKVQDRLTTLLGSVLLFSQWIGKGCTNFFGLQALLQEVQCQTSDGPDLPIQWLPNLCKWPLIVEAHNLPEKSKTLQTGQHLQLVCRQRSQSAQKECQTIEKRCFLCLAFVQFQSG